GYRCDGEALDSMPAEVERLARVEPLYETLPGWQKSLSHVRRLADLPAPAAPGGAPPPRRPAPTWTDSRTWRTRPSSTSASARIAIRSSKGRGHGAVVVGLAVIGAGPCGLAVGVAAKRARLTCSLFDKGPVASSLMRYPLYMTFFSPPDKLEIGVPFVTAGDKPTRREALTYYRKVAEHFELDVRQYHTVSRATRTRDGFELVAQHPGGPEPETVSSRHLVFATGYFESPNPLRVPGEDLPHVSHFFVEPHPYWQQRVVVVGGGNSAVEAALELCRVGARVTMVHFLSEFDRGVKPWILPDIANRVKEGRVAVRWCSSVVEIGRAEGVVRRDPDGERETIPADFVLALTGYTADLSLLRSVGVAVDETSGIPRHAPETMETNVPGVYIAGVLASGFDANKIFIENGREHGARICDHIKSKPPRVAPGGGSPARHRAP